MTFAQRALSGGLAALILLGGCTVLPERSAKKTFLLPPPDFIPSDHSSIPLTLRVLTPHTEPPLNGTQILVNPQANAIQAYSGARWEKPTPLLIRDYWLEGLRQSQIFRAVIHETSDAASDLTLSSDLTVFRLGYPSGQPTVLVQVDALLLDSESGKVLAARRFNRQQVVQDKPVEALISGFGSVNQSLAADLSKWLTEISRALSQETDPATLPSNTGSSTKE